MHDPFSPRRVNIEAIETHLRVLRETEYPVKSAHGISPNFFKCTTDLLILGLLQGSAAVRIMWTMLSTLAFTVLSLRSPPAHFVTPRIEVYTEQPGEAFVDDTTLWTTSYATTCIVAIITRAAVKAQAWARIIFVRGGWLNLKMHAKTLRLDPLEPGNVATPIVKSRHDSG